MNTQRVIALVGKKTSGKSTIASILENHHDFQRISFAQVLRDIAEIIGLSLEGDKQKIQDNLGISLRGFLQSLGDFFRYDLSMKYPMWCKDGPSLTTRLLIQKIKNNPNVNFVVDDVRYLEELEALQTTFNTTVWIVHRDNIQLDEYSSHSSETQVDHIAKRFKNAQVVENNRDLHDLYSLIDKLL
jgi:dephospho-CoA kinase